MFLDNTQADLATAREQLDSMETEHKELADEYIALKTSHVQLTADHQKEVGTHTYCNLLFDFCKYPLLWWEDWMGVGKELVSLLSSVGSGRNQKQFKRQPMRNVKEKMLGMALYCLIF